MGAKLPVMALGRCFRPETPPVVFRLETISLLHTSGAPPGDAKAKVEVTSPDLSVPRQDKETDIRDGLLLALSTFFI